MINVILSTFVSGLPQVPASQPLTYRFPAGRSATYEIQVKLEGWIPLFGGREGTADVRLQVVSTGKTLNPVAENPEPQFTVYSKITDLKATAFGVGLPVNTSNIDQFFPPADATLTHLGKVLKNSAPNISMPVKLPGLDSQRLPEISYAPLELPKADSSEKYRFQRSFNGVPVNYTVTPAERKNQTVEFKIELDQKTESFQDAFGADSNAVKATYKVLETLTGSGNATFDLEKGLFTSLSIESVSATQLTSLKPNRKSKAQKLKTHLIIKLVPPNSNSLNVQ